MASADRSRNAGLDNMAKTSPSGASYTISWRSFMGQIMLHACAHAYVGPHGAGELRQVRRGGWPAHLRQLPAAVTAAVLPAAGVPAARARRVALHHRPPGLRAVVPAAAARGRDGARRAGR